MRIKIIGDDSINRQACTYAEYRLFAALSQVLDTGRVRNASLVLRRAKSRRHRDGVVCTVTVELNSGKITRLRTFGEHPYAAINRAIERFRLNARSERLESIAPGDGCHRMSRRCAYAPLLAPFRATGSARSSTQIRERLG